MCMFGVWNSFVIIGICVELLDRKVVLILLLSSVVVVFLLVVGNSLVGLFGMMLFIFSSVRFSLCVLLFFVLSVSCLFLKLDRCVMIGLWYMIVSGM